MRNSTRLGCRFRLAQVMLLFVLLVAPKLDLRGQVATIKPVSHQFDSGAESEVRNALNSPLRNLDLDYAKHRNWLDQADREAFRIERKERSKTRLYYGVEHVNWKMRRRDLDFAVTHDNQALAIGSGEIKELSFDRDDNFKAIIGVNLADGWKAGVVYSNFRTSESMSLASLSGETLFSTRSHPRFNEEAFDANIHALFDTNTFDAEVRGDIALSDKSSITVFGGFRWMDVGQNVQTNYDGIDFAEGVITQKQQSDLFGLRIGGLGKFQATEKFYVFGSIESTLAYGHHSFSLLESDSESGTPEVLVDIEDTYSQGHLFAVAAFGAGLMLGDYDIRMGYELNYWGGMAGRLVFLDDAHEAMFSHATEDIILDGVFIRLSRGY